VRSSGRHVINAGRVGKAKHGDPRACSLVLTADDSTPNVQFPWVEYDARHIEHAGMSRAFADMLRTGTS